MERGQCELGLVFSEVKTDSDSDPEKKINKWLDQLITDHWPLTADPEKKIKKWICQLRDNRKDRQTKNAKTAKKEVNLSANIAKNLSVLCVYL